MAAPAGRTGRRPGTPETRDDILASARTLFAEKGFAKASVRAIAQDAGVDPALVHHYFGTKDALFEATLELPIDPADVVGRIASASPDELPRRVAEVFLGVWEGERTGPAMLAVLRRALGDPAQAHLIRDLMFRQIKASPLAAKIAGGPGEVELRMSLVVTQLLGTVISRQVLHIEPMASLPRAQVVDLLVPTVTHALFGDLDAAANPAPTGAPS